MRLKVSTMPAALLLLLCIACHSKTRQTEENRTVEDKDVAASAGMVAADSAAYKPEENAPIPQRQAQFRGKRPAPPPVPNPDWDKKIIKTANLSLEVKNFRTFTDRLQQMVQRAGGYTAQEQQTQSPSIIENTVTIKVPVDELEDFLSRLPSDSDRLVDRKLSSEDVTGEVVDTRSRLDTRRAARERYLELLKQAKTMDDVIAIQGVIDNIQEEMDAAAGRIAYLSHSAAFSVVNLKFYQVLDESGRETSDPSMWRRIMDSISQGWEGFGAALVWLLSVWPLLLLGALVWMGVRRQAKKTAAARKVLPVGQPADRATIDR
ncbi:MAG: DUF4349 domain-containing protein [Bacteroidetes bacterium]|nr:DUF4349 domain-containing protein [Bacteroidota bacterium]